MRKIEVCLEKGGARVWLEAFFPGAQNTPISEKPGDEHLTVLLLDTKGVFLTGYGPGALSGRFRKLCFTRADQRKINRMNNAGTGLPNQKKPGRKGDRCHSRYGRGMAFFWVPRGYEV